MSLFYPYYDANGRRNNYPNQRQQDPLTRFFTDLNQTAELFNKAATQNTIFKRLKELDNTPFDTIVTSDGDNSTYIINVPEGVDQDDVFIDVSDDNRTLIIEVSKEHENGSSESYRHVRTTSREIDVDNLQAYLDTAVHQVILEIPFTPEETRLEEVEKTVVPLQITSSNKKEGKREDDSLDEDNPDEGKGEKLDDVKV